MHKHQISAALITFNEESNIARTLEKLTWCDEIVVIDSNSTDKTKEICASFGAKVYSKEFKGYGEQKRFLVEKCSFDWVLSVDADEVLTNELINEIQTEFSKQKLTYKAYLLNRKHVYLGKVFKYGYLKNTPILRLFNKNYANFSDKKVHETVEYKGKKGRFKNVFYHYTASTVEQINYKKNRYATLVSEEYFKKRKRVNLLILLFKYPLAFIKEYFIRGNILNGYEGYVWSTYIAEYSVLKYLKLRERNKNAKS
ncbi:glycosyltransferase involved in cell wall biosynthesis [Tenacibaculum skagerrakense]|uniref:Glycosyltransferase involved in cell wall biosynthesis n=1 Tax=Tenacibaculum skagerrakense TaxID=186571 RepID=A0A4R2NVY3_9FLAO|nr:glycosyltransferase family 2 protein [Tenacibaculum skagerrakense]TCP25758.1 glycosyltransferase involved in cell wall biosynthesis [Tenacibaculum skagerrakense]